MRAILLELKKAIDTELDEPEYQQLTLFDDLERDQFERNKDFLRARSKAIPPRSNEKRRRSSLATPTRSPGCSLWR